MNCPTRDQLEGDPHPDWNQNPPFLAPELTTRASLVCGGKKDGRYDLPLHVLALFIILVLSTLACSFPLMVKKFPWLKVPHHFLFGTGVLIATAFVHLLPTAFTSLTDPCLPPFWNQSYPAMAGLISMCAVFLVRRGSRHRRSGSIAGGLRSFGRTRPIQPALPPTTRRHGHTRTFSNASRQSSSGSIRPLRRKLTDAQQQQKNLLQVVLLEAGILFHSIFIGMALSVATGSNFIVLLIAISFHQTFEGLALGSRIAALRTFPPGSLRPWLMALAYGTTTPFGQAIGLATRNLYDPQSQTGLLMVGVMNAISSGLLLFAGLVELLAEDFLSDESYVVLRGKRRVQAGLAVVAGAAGMAAVGAWA
ncbi:Zinc/iron permease [Tirmania nivea]|nr:Zinc/iron permease [Tirmania nivea]